MESIIFRIMNLDELHKLEQENEAITDAAERSAREALLDEVLEKITDYDVHVRNYAFKQSIKAILERGVTIEKANREEITARWDKRVDALVSEEVKKFTQYYSDQFRWHIFSFELLGCVSGDDARKVFDCTYKNELYVFFDCADEAYLVRNCHLITAADIEEILKNAPLDYSDMYFFDSDGKWTYIRPHEDYCGPYFFRAE